RLVAPPPSCRQWSHQSPRGSSTILKLSSSATRLTAPLSTRLNTAGPGNGASPAATRFICKCPVAVSYQENCSVPSETQVTSTWCPAPTRNSSPKLNPSSVDIL